MKLVACVHVVVAFGCLAVLAVSIYPGVLNDLLFPMALLSIVVIPVFAILGLILALWIRRRRDPTIMRAAGRHVLVVIGIILTTYILLRFYIPRRIAFAISKPSFERFISETGEPRGARAPDRRVGLYKIEQVATDSRGGIYFRVHRGHDGIGPDVMSYGFCYDPNTGGTPYGAAHYRVFHLGDGWYWFRASDDWH